MIGRQQVGAGASVDAAGLRIEHLGNTEIEQLDVPFGGNQDVRGLEITVDDQVGVRGVDRIGYMESHS